MIDRKSELVIVGESYLSYLLGINLIRQKKKVLVIDDERLGFGHYFGHCLSELDLLYLESWCQEYDIDFGPIKKDVYDHTANRTLVFGNKHLMLGSCYLSNADELFRKLPFLFSPSFRQEVRTKQTHESFNLYLARVGKALYKYQHFQNYSLKQLEESLPEALLKLFESFKQKVSTILGDESEKSWEKKSVLYLLRSLFHHRLSLTLNEFELFHLFLSLLAPIYTLRQNLFLDNFKVEFLKRGGQLKSTRVESWQFHRGRPWCLQLASYEGVLQPKKVIVLGSLPFNMPIELNHNHRIYRGIRINWKLKSAWDHFKCAKNKVNHYSFCDHKTLGSPIPLTNIVINEQNITAYFFRENRVGEKVDFYSQELRKKLVELLEKIAPRTPSVEVDLESEVIEYSKDIVAEKIGGVAKFFRTGSVRLFKGPSIQSFDGQKLQDVHYFGHFSTSGLGLLSTMVEMREKYSYL